MKLFTILSILMLSFILNGCFIDRIRQRMYAKKPLEERNYTIIQEGEVQVETIKKPKLYTPSAPQIIEEDTFKKQEVKKIKKRKKVHKRAKKRAVKKKVHKIVDEPYSIEKNEHDPELLGPQTTLKSNPLEKQRVN